MAGAHDDHGDEVEKDGIDEAEVEDDHGDVSSGLEEVYEGYHEF